MRFKILSSVLLGASFAFVGSVQAQDAISLQIKEAESQQQWQKAISIIDQFIRANPDSDRIIRLYGERSSIIRKAEKAKANLSFLKGPTKDYPFKGDLPKPSEPLFFATIIPEKEVKTLIDSAPADMLQKGAVLTESDPDSISRFCRSDSIDKIQGNAESLSVSNRFSGVAIVTQGVVLITGKIQGEKTENNQTSSVSVSYMCLTRKAENGYFYIKMATLP